nr:T9SS type A sorting domain-containing protein [Bacteroidota bacterium]
SIPVMDGIVGSWVSDIDDNGHAELIYSTKKDVLAYEFEENENIIGRQGEHADFRNSGISQYPAYLNQNQCKTWWDGEVYLSDTTIIYSGDSLIIKPYTKIKAAENSQIIVYGTLISDGLSYHPITCNADTAGAGKSYWKGLGFKNGSKSSVSYSNIDNAQYGLYYEDALSYQQLSNSILKNNTVGIGAFNCDPDIKECLVTGNTHGVANYSNSTTGLSGWFNSPQEQFKNKIYNNSNGISIYSSTPLLDHGYNDIYNSPASGNYAIFFYEDERTVLRSTNNYWGTTDTSVINRHLTTPSMFCITPVLDSSYTQYKSGGLSSEQELLISANTLISSSNYNDAKNTLNQLINEYPASGEAVVGLGKLYGCFLKQSTVYEMEEFINALHSIPKDTSMTFSTAIIKAALGYYGLGCRHAGNFESAIHIYDSVLINNPSYNDSVFALINLGNTLIEYEDLYKSTYQHHVFMQNVDRAVHTGLTQDLLLLLKQTEPKEAQFGNNGSINIKISPNPFTQSTSVTIDAPESGRLTVSLYTIGGIKVATITDRQINESGHPIQFEINGLDLNLPGKGIYLLKICIGSSSTTKKIIHY